MQRTSDSHKGDNGTIVIVGGSPTMHGAPLMAALAAEASGVDLLYVCLPASHTEVAKSTSLNFQVHPFSGDALSEKDHASLLELLSSIDVAVIGPGIAEGSEHILKLLKDAPCKVVADAGALQADSLKALEKKDAIITPHEGELQRMKLATADLQKVTELHKLTMLIKGEVDFVYSPKKQSTEVQGGNAGLTVGGTGDVLAGLVGGLVAQGMDAYDACVVASTIVKRAGTLLYHELGYAYTALDVVAQVPHVLHTYEHAE